MSSTYSRYFSALTDYNAGNPIDDRDLDGEFDAMVVALNRKVLCASSAPSSPIAGQTWVDTTNKLLKIYLNNEWLVHGPVAIGTEPTTAFEGMLWYDSANNLLKQYNGSGWDTNLTTADLVDEDDMASDSATKVPSQQSVKKYVDDTVKVLGTWGDVSTSTSAIQATTDGFVVGCWISTVNDAGISGTVKTDANSTPTTVRTQCALGGGPAVDIGSKYPFCCPVKKDDYYLVEGSSMTVSHYFIPLS